MFLKVILIFIFLICISAKPIVPHESIPKSVISHTSQAPVIGYDCNQTEPEILTLSALEVGPCPTYESLKPVTSTIIGQIIQKREYELTQVRTCQVTKSTSYFKCGRNWANYQVYPAMIGQIVPISAQDCTKIHNTNSYTWSPFRQPWSGLNINETHQMSSNEIGWTDYKGYCEGGTVSIAGIEHHDVVVQVSMTISLRESWAKIDKASGRINVEEVQCPYSKGYCHDAITGSHTWVPHDNNCPEDAYIELYKGKINITTGETEGVRLLSINQPPFLFSSEIGTKTYTCGMSLQLTEFPDIFLVPQQANSFQSNYKPAKVTDIQFITYLNAKMTFTYHDLLSSARDMYLQAMMTSCEVEREMLKNRIEIVRLNSNKDGLSSLISEGMFARANGEVLHLIKCEPVPVTLRNSDSCYDALPIVYNDENVFLLPNTRIISKFSNIIPCTPITPITYKIGGKWWAFIKSFQPVKEPEVLKPKDISHLKFERIRSFSRGGMYDSEQIEAVQKLFAFPTLREAITTDLAIGVTQYYGSPMKMDLTSVMSDSDWEKILQSHITRYWGIFASFGNAVSGLIGFYLIYRLVKGFLVCFIDFKELFKTFGWSMKIFAACWSRLARYFLDQARETPTQSQESHLNTTTSEADTNPSIPDEVQSPLMPRFSPTIVVASADASNQALKNYTSSVFAQPPSAPHHDETSF